MEAIATHESLRTLKFVRIHDEHGRNLFLTRAVADMLLVNEQVGEIPFDSRTFDQDLWDSQVIPRIECNIYRKRFVPLQIVEEASTRAAIVASASARVAKKPYLVWMFLSQNCYVLCHYLDETLTRDDN
jgi:hypothetical protein